jgi:hypothetical protein
MAIRMTSRRSGSSSNSPASQARWKSVPLMLRQPVDKRGKFGGV